MLIHGATDNDIHPPLFGAAQRLFGLYRGLARRHAVRVLCMVPNRNRGAREETVAGVAISRRKAWYTALAWRLERSRLTPLFLAAHGHRARAAALAHELPGDPDVLMTDLHLTGVLERGVARLRVHHAHNVEYDHFRLAGPAVAITPFWADRLRLLEARAMEVADLVVAASDEDAARFAALYRVPAGRIVVAVNGYDETEARPATAAARARAREALGVSERECLCLFVGSDVPHNRQGLRLLTEQVMPPLSASGFRLLVVGRVARALSSRREPWLIARGESPRLAPFLDAADVGLNPVLTGGGSNIKLPTYLAAGLAVVTTPHGLRGYEPLRPLTISAEPREMAEAIRARPCGWARSGASAPAALGDYAWGAIGERLGEAFAARLPASDVGAGEGGAGEAGRMRA